MANPFKAVGDFIVRMFKGKKNNRTTAIVLVSGGVIMANISLTMGTPGVTVKIDPRKADGSITPGATVSNQNYGGGSPVNVTVNADGSALIAPVSVSGSFNATATATVTDSDGVQEQLSVDYTIEVLPDPNFANRTTTITVDPV